MLLSSDTPALFASLLYRTYTRTIVFSSRRLHITISGARQLRGANGSDAAAPLTARNLTVALHPAWPRSVTHRFSQHLGGQALKAAAYEIEEDWIWVAT
jgi:hypothetical protein